MLNLPVKSPAPDTSQRSLVKNVAHPQEVRAAT
jgi:hypothetical protein